MNFISMLNSRIHSTWKTIFLDACMLPQFSINSSTSIQSCVCSTCMRNNLSLQHVSYNMHSDLRVGSACSYCSLTCKTTHLSKQTTHLSNTLSITCYWLEGWICSYCSLTCKTTHLSKPKQPISPKQNNPSLQHVIYNMHIDLKVGSACSYWVIAMTYV